MMAGRNVLMVILKAVTAKAETVVLGDGRRSLLQK